MAKVSAKSGGKHSELLQWDAEGDQWTTRGNVETVSGAVLVMFKDY
jgi:hypothetical protein